MAEHSIIRVVDALNKGSTATVLAALSSKERHMAMQCARMHFAEEIDVLDKEIDHLWESMQAVGEVQPAGEKVMDGSVDSADEDEDAEVEWS